MLVTVVGLGLVVFVALFVSWPLLWSSSGSVLDDRTSSGLGASGRDGQVSRWQREKSAALAAIKDAEFDHRVGKLSDGDYSLARAELEGRALEAMVALEAEAASDRGRETEPGPGAKRSRPVENGRGRSGRTKFCSQCGMSIEKGARFCASCGRHVFRTTERNEDPA